MSVVATSKAVAALSAPNPDEAKVRKLLSEGADPRALLEHAKTNLHRDVGDFAGLKQAAKEVVPLQVTYRPVQELLRNAMFRGELKVAEEVHASEPGREVELGGQNGNTREQIRQSIEEVGMYRPQPVRDRPLTFDIDGNPVDHDGYATDDNTHLLHAAADAGVVIAPTELIKDGPSFAEDPNGALAALTRLLPDDKRDAALAELLTPSKAEQHEEGAQPSAEGGHRQGHAHTHGHQHAHLDRDFRKK